MQKADISASICRDFRIWLGDAFNSLVALHLNWLPNHTRIACVCYEAASNYTLQISSFAWHSYFLCKKISSMVWFASPFAFHRWELLTSGIILHATHGLKGHFMICAPSFLGSIWEVQRDFCIAQSWANDSLPKCWELTLYSCLPSSKTMLRLFRFTVEAQSEHRFVWGCGPAPLCCDAQLVWHCVWPSKLHLALWLLRVVLQRLALSETSSDFWLGSTWHARSESVRRCLKQSVCIERTGCVWGSSKVAWRGLPSQSAADAAKQRSKRGSTHSIMLVNYAWAVSHCRLVLNLKWCWRMLFENILCRCPPCMHSRDQPSSLPRSSPPARWSVLLVLLYSSCNHVGCNSAWGSAYSCKVACFGLAKERRQI